MKPHRNRVFRFTPTIYFWRHIVKQALCLSSHLYHLLRVWYFYKTDRKKVTWKQIFLSRVLLELLGFCSDLTHLTHFQKCLLKRAPESGVLWGREKKRLLHGYYRRVQFGKLAVNEHANASALILLFRSTWKKKVGTVAWWNVPCGFADLESSACVYKLFEHLLLI